MEKVNSLLSKKQHSFNQVLPDHNLRDAMFRMNCENTDFLVVIDEEDQFLGILSDHEVASSAMLSEKPIEILVIRDVMKTNLPVIAIDDTVESCIKLMNQFNVRYLPVFDKFRFCGIISSDDILQEALYNRSAIFDDEGEPVF